MLVGVDSLYSVELLIIIEINLNFMLDGDVLPAGRT